MAKQDREKELAGIIKKEMPGYHLRVTQSARKAEMEADVDRSASAAEATTPSLDTLRAKYLGKTAAKRSKARSAKRAAPVSRKAAKTQDDATEIVLIERDGAPSDAFERLPAKAVVIDRKSKKIIGAQG